jgi:hypothetical protein
MKPLGSLFVALIFLAGDPVIVRDNEELRMAVRDLKPGATIKIAPGGYSGGHYIAGLKDVTIEGSIRRTRLISKAAPMLCTPRVARI